jgi:hypothetical protein
MMLTDDVVSFADNALVLLTEKAERLGLCIEQTEPDPDLPPDARGPYVLRCALTGADVHVGGCSLMMLHDELKQIAGEDSLLTRPVGIEASIHDIEKGKS